MPQILDIIKQNKFFPAHNKIHYHTYRSEITGLMVSGSSLQLMPEMRKEVSTNIYLKAYATQIANCNRQRNTYSATG